MFPRLLRAAALALERRPALVVWALVLIGAVHLLTINISPTVWQDEVQTVDFGRSIITPETDWSLSWSASQHPVVPVSYLGPFLQETAYRSLAPSIIGPRLSSLLGALVAAYVVFLWLRSRLVSTGPALALSLVFLVDPMFVQGYRGARVDGWVIALVVAACLLVRRSGGSAGERGMTTRLMTAGALMVVAAFVWPSAVFLFPLMAAEVLLVLAPLKASWRTALQWGFAALAGGVLALALCLLPMIALIPAMMADTAAVVQTSSSPGSVWSRLPPAIWQLVLSYQYSPIVPLAAAAAAWTRGNRILAAMAIVAAMVILSANVYVHRAVYLLPYLIGLIGESWQQAAGTSRPRAWQRMAVAVALVWGVGLSLLARPALALTARTARDPERLVEAAAQLPALRSARVYLERWEFYYAGRQHGWKMVIPYGRSGAEAWRTTFASLDYALLGDTAAAEQDGLFADMGWQLASQFTMPSTEAVYPGRQPGPPRRYHLYSRVAAATPIK